MMFDGYVTPELDPVTYCGRLDQEAADRREYLSVGDRMVIRYPLSRLFVDCLSIVY